MGGKCWKSLFASRRGVGSFLRSRIFIRSTVLAHRPSRARRTSPTTALEHDELQAKGQAYLGMFKTFGPGVAEALAGTDIVSPDETYDGASSTLDLGGRQVELRTWGLAHTRGDQVVWLPDEKIVFVGDLAEERIFPIFPWFPPDDADLDAARWTRDPWRNRRLGAEHRGSRPRQRRGAWRFWLQSATI